MPNNLALPPVEYCRGTTPSHAAKSRPFRKAAPLPMAVTMAVATIGPMAGICRMRGHRHPDHDDRSFAGHGLHLETQGAAIVAGAGSRQSASIAKLDLLEAGSRSVANQRVVVYDLQNLQSADLHIQGILGEDFLEHFDMLIDNAHNLLCLDDTGAMRAGVKGTHIPLVDPVEAANGAVLPDLLIIAAHLTDGTRPVRLVLDSGANAPVLYNTSQYMALELTQTVVLRGNGVDGAQRIFSALPPQDVKIGPLELSGVPFFRLAGSQKDPMAKGFDGVLTMGLFRRVF